MQCGYGDELFQPWNSGKIRQKDLPENGRRWWLYDFGPLREVASGARAV